MELYSIIDIEQLLQLVEPLAKAKNQNPATRPTTAFMNVPTVLAQSIIALVSLTSVIMAFVVSDIESSRLHRSSMSLFSLFTSLSKDSYVAEVSFPHCIGGFRPERLPCDFMGQNSA